MKMSLYDDVLKAKPLFKNAEEAFEFYTKAYEALGAKYNMSGDEFWEKAENSSKEAEDYSEIRSLRRALVAARYFMDKKKDE
jgi:hypothetical protein